MYFQVCLWYFRGFIFLSYQVQVHVLQVFKVNFSWVTRHCVFSISRRNSSPNDEDYDSFDDVIEPALRFSPSSHGRYGNAYNSKDESVNNNNDLASRFIATARERSAVTAFRRQRGDGSVDEESRRRDLTPRRAESLDRRPLVRSSTFERNADVIAKRVSTSFDSLDSPPRSRRLLHQASTASSTTEMSGLVRRIHGMKIVSVTPETSVWRHQFDLWHMTQPHHSLRFFLLFAIIYRKCYRVVLCCRSEHTSRENVDVFVEKI